MISIGDLLAVLRLQNELSPEVDRAKESLFSLDKATSASAYQLTLLGRGAKEAGVLLSAALTTPIIGAAAAAVKFGSDFEATTQRLVTLANVQKNELEGVREHILNLAPAVGVGPNELAKAMYAISSTVQDTNVALQILDISAKSSAAGLGTAEVVARALTSVINSYGKENITAAHAADILTKAVKDGGAEAKALAPVLANVVPFAAKMGVTFEQVAANFAVVTKAGVPASEAITQLTSVFSALARETPRGEAALESVGMSYAKLKDEVKNQGLEEALLHLKDAFAGNDKGLYAVLGRLEALKDLLAVTGAQAKDYKHEVEEMTGANNDAEESFKGVADTAEQMQKQINASLETISIRLSKSLLPVWKEFLVVVRDDILPAVEKIVAVFNDLPPSVQKTIFVFLALLAAIGPVLIIIGQLLMAVGNITRGIQVLIGPISGLIGLIGEGGLVAALGTLGPALIAVTALVVAFYAAWKIGHIKEAADEIINQQKRIKESQGQPIHPKTPEELKQIFAGTEFAAGTIEVVKNTTAMAASVDVHKSLIDRVKELTETQKENIMADKAKGLTIQQTAADLKLSADVVGVYVRQQTAAAAATKKANEELEKTREAQQRLRDLTAELLDENTAVSAETRNQILYYHLMGASISEIANAKIAEKGAVQGVIKEYERQRQIQAEVNAEWWVQHNLQDEEYKKNLALQQQGFQEQDRAALEYYQMIRDQSASAAEDQINHIQDWVDAQILAWHGLPEQYAAYLDTLKKIRDAKRNASGAVADEVLDENGVGTGQAVIGSILSGKDYEFQHQMIDPGKKAANAFLKAFSAGMQDFPSLIIKAMTGGGGFMGAFSALGANITDKLFGQGGTLSKFTASLSSGISNVAQDLGLGKTLSTALGAGISGMLPMVGSLVAPLIGKLAGVLNNVFGGPNAQELAGRKVAAEFEKNFNGVQDMINKVGQAYIDNGHSAEEAQAAIKRMWDAEKEGAEATGRAVAELNEMLKRAGEISDAISNLGIKSHDELVHAADIANAAYEKIAAGVASGQFTAEDAAKAYRAYQEALAATGDEAAKIWLQAHQEMKSFGDQASDAGYKTVEELQQIADKAVALWQYMRDSGKYSAADIQDAFEKAQKAQDAALGRNSKLVEDLRNKYKSLADAVAQEAPEADMGVIEKQMRSQMKDIEQQIKDAGGSIDGVVQDIADKTAGAMTDAAGKVKGATNDMGIDIDNIVLESANTAKDQFNDVATTTAKNFDDMGNLIKDGLVQDTGEAADEMTNKLNSIYINPIHVRIIWDPDAMPTGLNGGTRGFNGEAAEADPGILERLGVNMMAEGGDFIVKRPTLFMAGEKRPERATFSSDLSGTGDKNIAGAIDRLTAELEVRDRILIQALDSRPDTVVQIEGREVVRASHKTYDFQGDLRTDLKDILGLN